MPLFRSEIESLTGYTPGEQPQAGKFIKLNTNENPYPASPQVAQAIESALRLGLGRYPDPHATAFRLRAAEIHGVQPDWILCGNGSDDILTILTRACVPSGGRLRMPYPSYVLYKTLAKLQGASSQEIPFQPDWQLPPEFGASEDDIHLALLPNPNSPTGTMVSNQQILELAQRLPCPLLVDEAYAAFADHNAVSLVAADERILVSRSLSKSHALAGLRFGYVIAQPQIIEQLQKVKDSYNCDSLAIAGATAAIDDQSWLEDVVKKICRTRDWVSQKLRELGFSSIPSQANFVWCRHPDCPAEAIFNQLKQQRVLVRYMNYARWQDGLRITIGTDDQMDACLRLLRETVDNLTDHPS